MLLLIDACPRTDSRTRHLAQYLIRRLDEPAVIRNLSQTVLPPLDESRLLWRTECSTAGDFSDPYFDLVRQFAAADTVVIAAPYWDLSFPALLKQYLESVCVTGLTFRYSPEGIPIGMCRAKRLWYVTTAGGPMTPDFGFGYVKALAQGLFGIADCRLVSAENLDILGSDPEAILRESRLGIDAQINIINK